MYGYRSGRRQYKVILHTRYGPVDVTLSLQLIQRAIAAGEPEWAAEEAWMLESAQMLAEVDAALGRMEARAPSVSDPQRYASWLKQQAPDRSEA